MTSSGAHAEEGRMDASSPSGAHAEGEQEINDPIPFESEICFEDEFDCLPTKQSKEPQDMEVDHRASPKAMSFQRYERD
eukprot:5173359-Amphidinium_carterae.1